MQALEELCIKPKNYRDLISDEPFARKDIITIQDSQKVDGLNYDRLLKVRKAKAFSLLLGAPVHCSSGPRYSAIKNIDGRSHLVHPGP